MREVVDLHVQAHETLAAEQAGNASMEAAVSPALAASPNADGSTPPLPMEMMAGAVPPQGVPEDMNMAPPTDLAIQGGGDPVADILAALEGGQGPPPM